jgi:nanoRNase/pAp phosphatase (c-di-AMP/oligoRNAs hydrolase)
MHLKELVERSVCCTGTRCITIYCDKKGAVDLSKNMNHHPRTKPISIQHHFIRDRVTKSDISVFKIASKEMVADCITKGLGREDNNRCAKALGLYVDTKRLH